jgi:hypothetical protein
MSDQTFQDKQGLQQKGRIAEALFKLNLRLLVQCATYHRYCDSVILPPNIVSKCNTCKEAKADTDERNSREGNDYSFG